MKFLFLGLLTLFIFALISQKGNAQTVKKLEFVRVDSLTKKKVFTHKLAQEAFDSSRQHALKVTEEKLTLELYDVDTAGYARVSGSIYFSVCSLTKFV